MTEEAAWVCDHCGDEFWKEGLGPKPDGWWCLACKWRIKHKTQQRSVVDRLLEQALGKELD